MSAVRNIQAKQLADQVLASIERAPKLIMALADELGYSHHAIRVRLLALMADGKVHFVDIVTKGGLGKAKLWCLGAAAPEQVKELQRIHRERSELEDRGSISTPSQVTQRMYPNIGRRDPLVAALFGAACHTDLPQREHACA